MIVINFSSVEKLFKDVNIRELLPEFKDLFDKWKLGQFAPSLRPMVQKALLDLLNQLNQQHISKLESYLNDSIKVEKLDYTLVKNYQTSLGDAQERLNSLDLNGELFLYRNANQLYLATWR